MPTPSSTDPLLILSSTLQTAFEAVAGRAGIDPVIRPSEHADAQANGALGLAKELGQSPPPSCRSRPCPMCWPHRHLLIGGSCWPWLFESGVQ